MSAAALFAGATVVTKGQGYDFTKEDDHRYFNFMDSTGAFEGDQAREKWLSYFQDTLKDQFEKHLKWEKLHKSTKDPEHLEIAKDYKKACDITLRCIEDVTRLMKK